MDLPTEAIGFHGTSKQAVRHLLGRDIQPSDQHFEWLGTGLRAMSGALSTLPVDGWWPTLSREDRERARALFRAMGSGRGFVNDVRQAGPDTSGYRHWLLQQVSCPTLITASRTDAGVDFAHAKDLASTIPKPGS